jgi:acyl-CoA reductase-like NAD-dependent aldehyde dehydrogenase
MQRYQLYIDGQFHDASSGRWFDSYNPYTGEVWGQIAEGGAFDVDRAVQAAQDEDEAVAIANDSLYGLGSGVWTSDIGRAFRMSERIQAGTVWVNTYRAVSYMSPFGGYKDSGMGRENGIDAIREYLQVKSVWINTGAPTANPFTMR